MPSIDWGSPDSAGARLVFSTAKDRKRMTLRIRRFAHKAALIQAVATDLAQAVASRPADGEPMRLCLSDGLGEVCASLGAQLDAQGVDPALLDLWWSDERFVDITDPTRISTRTLAAFGTAWRFDPANVHPMPSPAGNLDVDAAALSHAIELGDHHFDLAVLAMADDGRIAGLAPGCPALSAPTPHSVIGVTDGDGERLTLTMSSLAGSRHVWIIAAGPAAATAVARVVAGDADLPAGQLRGQASTDLYVDDDAAALLPWHTCGL